jgi:uncharacterized protein (TIGR03067 family)
MTTWTRWAGLGLLAVAVAGPGVRGDDAKVSGDLKKMQGTWVNASDESGETRWVFDGETMKSTHNGHEHVTKVTVDPKANPHPSIDFAITDGPEDLKGKTSLGIYKLDGDRLTVCVAMPGLNTRPSEFKRVEDEAFLFELKREK